MPAQDSGIAALGTLLKRGDGASPEVFTSIAEVIDISGPNLKLDTTDSTHLADTWKGKKPTLLDGGDVKLTVNFIPTNATQKLVSAGIGYDMTQKTLRNFKLVFPDSGSTTWTFSAYVTGMQFKAPLNGMLRADLTLTIDGTPTFA